MGDQGVKEEGGKLGPKKKTSKEGYTHEHDVRVENVEDHVEKNSRGKERRQNQGRKDYSDEDQKRHQESKDNPSRKNSHPAQQENPAEESRSGHRNNYHENSRGRRGHDHRGSGRSQQGGDHDRHQQGGNKQYRGHDDRYTDHRQNRVPDERGFEQRQNRVPEPASEMNERFVKARTPESNSRKFEDPRGGAGKYGGHQNTRIKQ